MSDAPVPRTWGELFVASFVGNMMDEAPQDFLAWSTPRLTRQVVEMNLPEGEVVYRQGEAVAHIYYIISGRVELVTDGQPTWSFGDGAMVGVMDTMMARPYARNAIAAQPSHLLRLPAGDWMETIEDSIQMVVTAIRRMSTEVQRLELLAMSRDSFIPADPYAAPSEAAPPTAQNLVERIVVLRRVPALRRAGVQALASLASVATGRVLEPGDVLFPVGDADRTLYFVAHGGIETERAPSGPRERFGRGTMVAGFAAFADRTTYSAMASHRSHVLCVTEEDWFDVMEEHFDLTRSALMALIERREALFNAAGGS